MKLPLAALLALCVSTALGCRCFSSSHNGNWNCVRAERVWQAGTPGGVGCESCGCESGGCESGGCESCDCESDGGAGMCGCSSCCEDSSCGIESTGCRLDTTGGCSTGGCSGGCGGRVAGGAFGGGFLSGRRAVHGSSSTCATGHCMTGSTMDAGTEAIDGNYIVHDHSNFAPVMNGRNASPYVITDETSTSMAGVAMGAGTGMAAGGGRMMAGGGAMASPFGHCPRCGMGFGAGGRASGCGRCGLGLAGGRLAGGGAGPIRNVAGNMAANPHMQAFLEKTANGCNNGCCNLPPGPETGSVQYPYYTVRGPRDFLAKNPHKLGP